MTADDSALLEHRKIDVLFNQSVVALTAAPLVAVIITIAYWQQGHPVLLGVWLLTCLILCLCRYVLVSRYQNTDPGQRNHARLLKYYFYTSILSGMSWGGIGVYLLGISDITESSIIILAIGGLIAGAVATYSILIPVYFAFSVPAILPVILYLSWTDNSYMNLFGLLCMIFYALISASAVKLNRLVVQSLFYHHENLHLMNELEREKSRIIRLNSELEIDLARWKETEKQLTHEKHKAVELAEKLLAISTLDGLTGIPNRRNFDQALAKEWNRASRTDTPVSLVMCDIDHFKLYNDHYGHQKGDNCLIRIATTLQEHARRDGDLATRYGGEEFIVILPGTNLDNATEIAEQMRQSILDMAIPHRYSDTDNIVTASFGVATIIPKREQESRILISLADKALYLAKKQGRNRVVASKPELYSASELDADQAAS